MTRHTAILTLAGTLCTAALAEMAMADDGVRPRPASWATKIEARPRNDPLGAPLNRRRA